MINNPLPTAIEKLRSLPQTLSGEARQIVSESLDVINQIIDAQMEAGINGNGEPITPFYTPVTVIIKRQKGQPSDRVTLRDVGNFRNALVSTLRGELIITTSLDPKTADLVEKYGGEIFEVTAENREAFIDTVLLPKLLDFVQTSRLVA